MMECTDSLDEFSKLHTVLCYNLQWFAQDGEGGEKTEPATEKKLKDAREEGKVAKSKELTAAFDLIVLFLVLKIFISFVGGNLIGLFSTVYKKMPDFLMIKRRFSSRNEKRVQKNRLNVGNNKTIVQNVIAKTISVMVTTEINDHKSEMNNEIKVLIVAITDQIKDVVNNPK